MFRDDDPTRRLGKTERAKVVARLRGATSRRSPSDKRFDRDALLRAARRGRQVRLRDRQRRAAGVQPAGRGLQPGARQRRGAVDEAGQHPRGEPVRRHRRRSTRTSSTRATAPSSASGRCRCTPTRCSATPSSTGSGTSSRRCRRTRSTSTGRELTEPDDIARRGRPARPGHRQDPLRLRRGQRAGPRRLPGRGGDRRRALHRRRREFIAWLTDFGIEYADTGARRPRAVRRGLPRGPDRGRPRPARRLAPSSTRRRPRTGVGRRRCAGARNPLGGERRVDRARRPRRPARRAPAAIAEPPKPPPVIRAPSAPASTAVATAQVELGAGDLEVVAHRAVRLDEQPADLVPVAAASIAADRLGDAGDLGDDVPGPAADAGRRRAPRRRPSVGRAQRRHAERARPPPRSRRGGRRTRRRSARARRGCR